MRQRSVGGGFILGTLLASCLLLSAPARASQAGSSQPPVSPAPAGEQADPVKTNSAPGISDAGKADLKAPAAIEHSTGVDEILKMVEAGVSAEVVRTYIANSPIAYNLSATDIIALKEHAVPDELTKAMMNRGAVLKAQFRQAMAYNAQPPSYAAGNRRSYRFDPESYDYFQYYYLYPRTLAAANQRFHSPGGFASGFTPLFYGYSPGYYDPPPFWPLAPSAFGHP